MNLLRKLFCFAPTPTMSLLITTITAFEFWQNIGKLEIIPEHIIAFYGLILCIMFLLQLAVFWSGWGVAVKMFVYCRTASARKYIFAAITVAIWIAVLVYAAAWTCKLYTGVFPGIYSLRMLSASNGVTFAIHVLEVSTPWLFRGAGIFVGISLISIPIFTHFSFKSIYSKSSMAQERIACIWAIGAAFIALICIVTLLTGQNYYNQKLQFKYLLSKTTPIVAMGHSIYEAIYTGDIPPKIPLNTLLPNNQDKTTQTLTQTNLNILFLAAESLRADIMDKEINGIEITPNLNALARDSIVFTKGYSQCTHTDYALPSMLSSLYPLRTNEHLYYRRNDPWEKFLLYDHLAISGYKSAIITSDDSAWGSKGEFFWSKSLNTYFDSRNMPDKFDPNMQGYVSGADLFSGPAATVSDALTIEICKKWMEYNAKDYQPWFLHSMFQYTHFPYKTAKGYPEPFQPSNTRGMSITFFTCPPESVPTLQNAYYNAAHAMDIELGKLLNFLKENQLYEKTVIIFSGDHGEALGEHNFTTHAGPNIQAEVRVPMMIRMPGMEPCKVDYPTQHIDIAPTMCALIGIPPNPGWQGIDALSESRPALAERNLYFHSNMPPYNQEDAILNAGRWKLRNSKSTGRTTLFDIQNDPDETENLANKYPDIAKLLGTKLAQWRQNQLAYYTYPMFYKTYYPPKTLPFALPSSDNQTSTSY